LKSGLNRFLDDDQRALREPSAVARGGERLLGQAHAVGRIEEGERERRNRGRGAEPGRVAAKDLARTAGAERIDIAAQ
jgi:hypothetical protein